LRGVALSLPKGGTTKQSAFIQRYAINRLLRYARNDDNTDKHELVSKTYITILKKYKYNKWHIPLTLTVVVVFILSLRLLSDPDLGFHLNAGKWIIENFSFPVKDTFTFTAIQNDYIDLHWLFQVFIFIVFKITSYNGLSILVAIITVYNFKKK